MIVVRFKILAYSAVPKLSQSTPPTILLPSVNVSGCSCGHGIYRIHTSEYVWKINSSLLAGKL